MLNLHAHVSILTFVNISDVTAKISVHNKGIIIILVVTIGPKDLTTF